MIPKYKQVVTMPVLPLYVDVLKQDKNLRYLYECMKEPDEGKPKETFGISLIIQEIVRTFNIGLRKSKSGHLENLRIILEEAYARRQLTLSNAEYKNGVFIFEFS